MTTQSRISRLADLQQNFEGYMEAYNHRVMRQAMANVRAAEQAQKEREQAELEAFRADPTAGDRFIEAAIRAAARREEAIERGWGE